jgi:hypothetical protein
MAGQTLRATVVRKTPGRLYVKFGYTLDTLAKAIEDSRGRGDGSLVVVVALGRLPLKRWVVKSRAGHPPSAGNNTEAETHGDDGVVCEYRRNHGAHTSRMLALAEMAKLTIATQPSAVNRMDRGQTKNSGITDRKSRTPPEPSNPRAVNLLLRISAQLSSCSKQSLRNGRSRRGAEVGRFAICRWISVDNGFHHATGRSPRALILVNRLRRTREAGPYLRSSPCRPIVNTSTPTHTCAALTDWFS